MEDEVENKYFLEEDITHFEAAWKSASKCRDRSLRDQEKENGRLTKNQIQAVCLYTSNYMFKKDGLKFYQHFNSQVRTMKTQYPSFKFKSLHFWLTSAIQILSNDQECITTYRRTGEKFIGKVNQLIRFGFFASSSFEPEMTRFGKKTCFKITTCLGAPLKNYAYLRDEEKEVLIPPHEMFNITKISKKNFGNLADCENVYFLESAGIQSNLNCHAIKNNKMEK